MSPRVFPSLHRGAPNYGLWPMIRPVIRRLSGQGDRMELRLDVTKQAGVAVVRCRGRIVFGQEVDELRLTVLSLFKETSRVVLHLAGIEQIDSEGLAGLVGVFISARNRGGEVKLADLSQNSKKVLRLTRLDEVFETYESEADAVASFQDSNTAVVEKKRPA